MQNQNKSNWLDRSIAWISPKWANDRAYHRAVSEQLPFLLDGLGRSGQASAVYGSSTQGRLDNPWPNSRALHGFNAPLNRWRQTYMRDRAREQDRNNAVVTGMLDRASENVIGHGMRPRLITDDEQFNSDATEDFLGWLETCDLTGENGPAELQRLIYRSHLRDGDVGVNLVQRGDGSGGDEDFIQVVEGDLIDTMNGGYDLAERVVNGVKFDSDNRPVAYYVLSLGLTGVQMVATPIPVKNFLFLKRSKNFCDCRGEPCFAQNNALFDQIDGLVEAAVVAARIGCCQALLIKSANAGKILGGMATAPNSQNKPARIQSLEPGAVNYLAEGEEVEGFTPTQPSQSFPEIMSVMLRFAGLTLGLPLELVFLDFSRTTYSSARASLLQAYRTFRSGQQLFIDRIMRRLFTWRLTNQVRRGVLKVPARLLKLRPGEVARAPLRRWTKQEWIAPGWAWIDPEKEIKAAMMECDAGFNSEENVCLQHGRTIEEVLRAKKRTALMLGELGLFLSKSSMTRDVVITPTGPATATIAIGATKPDPFAPVAKPRQAQDETDNEEDEKAGAPETDE